MGSLYQTEYSQPLGVTAEADTVSINFSNAMNAYVGQSIFISNKIEAEKFRKFLELRDKWKDETLFVSSGSIIISNSAYREIINIGKIAIPWIVRELKRSDDHWFYALEVITGENPIKDENVGIVKNMKADWLTWASQKEYL